MSTAAGAPSNGPDAGSESRDKGKGKTTVASPDVSMEEEDDDDDDEDEEMAVLGDEDDEEEDDEEEEGKEEINPSAILGRRTRGVKVDYTSKAALEKAGLDPEEDEDEDEEDTK